MLSLIRHRGPDEAGYYLDDGLTMGAVRLAIVDLPSGAQPMADPSERHWICFNGELYNHVELREELRRLGLAVPYPVGHRGRPAGVDPVGSRLSHALQRRLCDGDP
ncbi:hypothetical protein GCM10020000_12090 [Streptomyces olivoverticillatus]